MNNKIQSKELIVERRVISLTTSAYKEKHNSSKNVGKQKPILEVISAGKIKASSKESVVLLENIKEKSLEKDSEQSSIISAQSIRKLKERIIGKSDEELKGKCLVRLFKSICIGQIPLAFQHK